MNKVIATITATVTTEVCLAEGETLEDYQQRDVDIYLHGPRNNKMSWSEKEDLGVNSSTIKFEFKELK